MPWFLLIALELNNRGLDIYGFWGQGLPVVVRQQSAWAVLVQVYLKTRQGEQREILDPLLAPVSVP